MTEFGVAAVTAVVAAVAAVLTEWLIASERAALQLVPTSSAIARLRPVFVTIVLTALVTALFWGETRRHCLETPEVQPSEAGFYARFVYHAVLVGLLVLATTIDFDCYLIPDLITIPGMLIGVLSAVVMQELQIAHLWIDWAYAVPQLRGPYIPGWYDQHRWAHALAWSLAGLAAGMVVTQGVRLISSRVLQMEAMGFGDVMLMGMIGCYLGWQAVITTFLIAPLIGLIAVALTRLTGNPRILPYGPFLSAAAMVTVFAWTQIWHATRMIFSDLVGLGLLSGIALGLLVLLLGGLRLYRSIPTDRDEPPQPDAA